MEELFSRVGASIKKAGLELLAFMGVSMTVSAAENLFMNLNKTNREAMMLSRNLNINVETLKLWEAVAAHFGASPSDIDTAFGKMSAEETRYHNQGVSDMPNAFRDFLRVDVEKTKGGAWLSGPEMVMAIRASAERNKWSDKELLGRLTSAGVPELAPIVNSQAKGGELERQLERVKKTGVTGTEAGANASEKLMKDLTDLKDAAMGIVQVVQAQLTPKVDGIVTKLTALIGENKEAVGASIVKFITDFSAGLVKLIADLDAFLKSQGWKDFKSDVVVVAGVANSAAEAMGGWGRAVEALATIWTGSKVSQNARPDGAVRTTGPDHRRCGGCRLVQEAVGHRQRGSRETGLW